MRYSDNSLPKYWYYKCDESKESKKLIIYANLVSGRFEDAYIPQKGMYFGASSTGRAYGRAHSFPSDTILLTVEEAYKLLTTKKQKTYEIF